ncbi:aminopeptidase Q-like isoform X3 [Nylanderia fulva]|uniref:aminopeptidase Q-like isoform X3 n=1 Tax=Nylanderia fulva TaxID=613905 RepID=UPI0010FAD428|nr:aminopeptidase Q-like isoform X3 [Nylanderia fulva]
MFLKVSLNILLYILVMTMAYSINKNARSLEHSMIDLILLNVTTSLHYDLKLSLKPGYVSHGEVNIYAYISCPTQYITLLTSENINVTQVNLKSKNGETYVPKRSYSHHKNKVVLNFAEEFFDNSLKCGFYILYVNFTNTDTEELSQTLYTGEEENKKFIATLFQPTKERPLFPCFNTSDFVSLNISVKHDRRYQVLSNMPIRNQSVSNDVMLTHFHTCPYTHIYKVAIILMTSDMTPSDPISFDSYEFAYSKIMINTWSRSHMVPHTKFAQDVLGNITRCLEDSWGSLRTGVKVDYVVIPNLKGHSMQTWGLLLCNEAYITYDEELYPAYKGTVKRLIAHDVIYQWFDGFFYPWHNYWLLNEGFIKFVEGHIVEKCFPRSRMLELFTIQDQHEYRYMDVNFPTDIYENSINDAHKFKINSLSIRQRIIGPIVWRMLKSVMPNSVFWDSIDVYANSGSTYNLRTPGNLWNIMQTYIENPKIKNYELNVQEIMNVWTQAKHCPVVNAIRHYNEAYVSVSIDKEQTFNEATFFIPITFTTEMEVDFKIRSSTIYHCLTESTLELIIPIINKNKWIIVNLQQTGYYRVNYDPENWRRIAHYLNSEDYINIHVLNRAQIIDDAFHLVMEKKLNSSIFWELVRYLPRREKNYLAWYPMIKVFEYLSNYFAMINALDEHLPSELQIQGYTQSNETRSKQF